MVIEDLTFELELDPGWTAIAEPLDAGTAQALRRVFTDSAPERVTVQVAPPDGSDVSGHALTSAMIDVVLTLGDDVEGHAFTLRFPSPEDAARMRTRLAAGGLLVAALAIGSIGVATQVAAPHTGAGAPAQAVPIAAPAPLTVSPALKADLRYPSDQETVVSVAPKVSAVGANDRGKGGGGESTTQSNASSDVPTIPKN